MEIILTKPKVSVCVVTYNQVKYIRQCLQSIVDQETKFQLEVIVGDDCSTDGTQAIVQEFSEKYPKILKPIFHSKNIGAHENYILIHSQAAGEYIVHVDGDDYCLPGKLQAQADYLDANKDCQILWHRMKIINSQTGKIYDQQYDGAALAARKFSVDDLISHITIGLHSSKMYRRWVGFERVIIPCYDFSENVMHLHITGGYAALLSTGTFGVYRANIGISRNRGKIYIDIYCWLMYFYRNGIGNKKLIAAKTLLMALSDLKHRTGSFQCGFLIALKMLPNLSLSMLKKCHAERLPISLNGSHDESTENCHVANDLRTF